MVFGSVPSGTGTYVELCLNMVSLKRFNQPILFSVHKFREVHALLCISYQLPLMRCLACVCIKHETSF